jgi:hypothetical protein
MFYYYAIAIYFGVASLCERFVRDRKLVFLLVLSSVALLTFFAGFRYNVGPDQGTYEEIFQEVPSIFEWSANWDTLRGIHGEYGYLLVNAVVKLCANNPVLLFTVIALGAVGLNLYSYYKYSPYALLSVYIYFTHTFLYKEMIQIRTGIASALVLFGVQYIADRKPLKYLSTITLAAAFHLGTIITLIAYCFKNLPLPRKKLYGVLVLVIALSQVHWLGRVIGPLNATGLVPYSVSVYIGWDLYNYSLGVFTNPTTVKQLVLCLVLINYSNVLIGKSKYFTPMFYMYFVSTTWLLLFNDFAIIAGRLASNLSVVEPVLVADLLLINKKNNHILILVVLIIYAFILCLNLEVKSLLLPYESILGA